MCMNNLKRTIPLIILANLIPIYFVFKGTISVPEIMFLYWLESLVIYVSSFFKIAQARRAGPEDPGYNTPNHANNSSPLSMAGFFMIHYGMFMLAHWFFIARFFTGSLVELVSGTFPILIGLIISHSISYFIYTGENRQKTVSELMFRPYGRVILMHLLVVFGGAILIQSNANLGYLILLILGKILFDILGHIWEHHNAELVAFGIRLEDVVHTEVPIDPDFA